MPVPDLVTLENYSTARQAVLEAVRKGAETSVEVAEMLGLDANVASAILSALESMKQVSCIGLMPNRRTKLYCIRLDTDEIRPQDLNQGHGEPEPRVSPQDEPGACDITPSQEALHMPAAAQATPERPHEMHEVPVPEPPAFDPRQSASFQSEGISRYRQMVAEAEKIKNDDVPRLKSEIMQRINHLKEYGFHYSLVADPGYNPEAGLSPSIKAAPESPDEPAGVIDDIESVDEIELPETDLPAITKRSRAGWRKAAGRGKRKGRPPGVKAQPPESGGGDIPTPFKSGSQYEWVYQQFVAAKDKTLTRDQIEKAAGRTRFNGLKSHPMRLTVVLAELKRKGLVDRVGEKTYQLIG